MTGILYLISLSLLLDAARKSKRFERSLTAPVSCGRSLSKPLTAGNHPINRRSPKLVALEAKFHHAEIFTKKTCLPRWREGEKCFPAEFFFAVKNSEAIRPPALRRMS